ncbi:hypothetical protein OG921_15505 [Aldersonia sp. NBC_00410]|uniref:hypothetical protein n=1 Tax=Aldersonia sp. NBC_00410 TaxID=2975954 RepID=UPI0022540CE1|nr:hypothetical protein [Aldersonia sp. NBC_00410]MCX5044577.1 hypothetical protein [Aldersonia sp. NBC_00410]
MRFVKLCVQEGVGDTGFLVDADLAQGTGLSMVRSRAHIEGRWLPASVPDWLVNPRVRLVSLRLSRSNPVEDPDDSAKRGSEADAVRAHFLVSASSRYRRLRCKVTDAYMRHRRGRSDAKPFGYRKSFYPVQRKYRDL